MQRGGVSKASKGINLSEDIFAGFNNTLRGGNVEFKEYIQVGKGRDVGLQQIFKFEAKLAQGAAEQSLSRDIARIGSSLDFARLLSFYHGGLGFYIANTLTIWALYLFVWSKFVWSLSGFDMLDTFSGLSSLGYWFGLMGFLTTLPIIATIGVERGFRHACVATAKMLFTGGPVFFMFHMATKTSFFEQTILVGGAKYRPTGRGFVTAHETFAEIYRFHATSHFGRAFELIGILLLYACFTHSTKVYFATTWPLWMIILSWSFAPFWFNPMGFHWNSVVSDFSDWTNWMKRVEGGPNQTWRTWWKEETDYMKDLTLSSKLVLGVASLRFAAAGVGILSYHQAGVAELLLCSSAAVVLLCISTGFRMNLKGRSQRKVRYLKAVITILALALPCVLAPFYELSLSLVLWTALSMILIISSATQLLQIFGNESSLVQNLCRLYHITLAASLLLPLSIVSALYVPAIIQTRLTFHNAFSNGVLLEDLLKGQKSRRESKISEEVSKLQDLVHLQQEQIDELMNDRLKKRRAGSNTNAGLTPRAPLHVSTVQVNDEEATRRLTLVGSPISAARELPVDNRPIPKTIDDTSLP